MLVSIRYGRRDSGQRAPTSSSGSRSAPVFTKFLSSITKQRFNHAVWGSAPVIRNTLLIARVSRSPVSRWRHPTRSRRLAIQRLDLAASAQNHVGAPFDALDEVAGHALGQPA